MSNPSFFKSFFLLTLFLWGGNHAHARIHACTHAICISGCLLGQRGPCPGKPKGAVVNPPATVMSSVTTVPYQPLMKCEQTECQTVQPRSPRTLLLRLPAPSTPPASCGPTSLCKLGRPYLNHEHRRHHHTPCLPPGHRPILTCVNHPNNSEPKVRGGAWDGCASMQFVLMSTEA